MRGRRLFIAAAIAFIAVAVAWVLFRPELAFIDRRVDEEFPAVPAPVEADGEPAAGPVAIASGEFRGLAHPTTGTATVYSLPEGGSVLRLTSFETSNGPDVHVYLVEPGGDTAQTVRAGRFVDLGSMKGNIGDQTYTIPADVSLEPDHVVSIWCARFGVNFGETSLMPASGDAIADGMVASPE